MLNVFKEASLAFDELINIRCFYLADIGMTTRKNCHFPTPVLRLLTRRLGVFLFRVSKDPSLIESGADFE